MMMDQMFTRHWALLHDEFTKDLHRGVAKVFRTAADAFKHRLGMNEAYDHRRLLSAPASKSILAGFAASAMTVALFVGAWAVSVPSIVVA
ncbi:hypothetical protein GRI89_06220 [Altererythrobacter salegens]|uniref:Uncharacterized protein n=1 Tax=Croceibacterium salegens TaxID=1737568 RepID=A0A6I4ST42_9SPHN|nr:hypothetical protein [Croceibacterium salegens]MXO59134.1 hypothetical protein [Croceibacterium salegens]